MPKPKKVKPIAKKTAKKVVKKKLPTASEVLKREAAKLKKRKLNRLGVQMFDEEIQKVFPEFRELEKERKRNEDWKRRDKVMGRMI
mgnify:CR=1 FL=1